MATLTAESLAWQDQAACRYDPDLFFSEGDPATPAAAEQIERAKRVCAVCPVRRECLADALASYPKFGIWAGLTVPELHLERRRARRAA